MEKDYARDRVKNASRVRVYPENDAKCDRKIRFWRLFSKFGGRWEGLYRRQMQSVWFRGSAGSIPRHSDSSYQPEAQARGSDPPSTGIVAQTLVGTFRLGPAMPPPQTPSLALRAGIENGQFRGTRTLHTSPKRKRGGLIRLPPGLLRRGLWEPFASDRQCRLRGPPRSRFGLVSRTDNSAALGLFNTSPKRKRGGLIRLPPGLLRRRLWEPFASDRQCRLRGPPRSRFGLVSRTDNSAALGLFIPARSASEGV